MKKNAGIGKEISVGVRVFTIGLLEPLEALKNIFVKYAKKERLMIGLVKPINTNGIETNLELCVENVIKFMILRWVFVFINNDLVLPF